MGFPLFVKLATGYASIGISDKSVCRSVSEAIAQCNTMLDMAHELDSAVFVERFLCGREFTAITLTTHTTRITLIT